MHEYNPAKFLMEQLDDELERKYREAQARGDYAEADRIAGQMQQSGPAQSTTALTRSDMENRMDSMLGGGASAQSTRGASPVPVPQEVPNTQGLGSQTWEQLGPDSISRWTNAISMGVGVPLGFTPFSLVGDALDLTAAGIHGARSWLNADSDPELSKKLAWEAGGAATAAAPGPAGSLASLSRFTAPAGRLMRSGPGQIGAALAGGAVADRGYTKPQATELPTGSEVASAQEDPNVDTDAAMNELERMLQQGDLDMSNMFYTRGVDPWNVGFRRDKPNKRTMMMYANFDQTAANIEASYLAEATPSRRRISNILGGIQNAPPAGSSRAVATPPPMVNPRAVATPQAAAAGGGAGGAAAGEAGVRILGQRRLGKAMNALAPSGALAALLIAGGAPWAMKKMFGGDGMNTGKASQPLVPGAGAGSGGGGAGSGHGTAIDKLSNSLGLVQGFNPALATINALFRRVGT